MNFYNPIDQYVWEYGKRRKKSQWEILDEEATYNRRLKEFNQRQAKLNEALAIQNTQQEASTTVGADPYWQYKLAQPSATTDYLRSTENGANTRITEDGDTRIVTL